MTRGEDTKYTDSKKLKTRIQESLDEIQYRGVRDKEPKKSQKSDISRCKRKSKCDELRN